MNFHQIKSDLKSEKYTDVQVAKFMGISIRLFYYYSKNAWQPTPKTQNKINKTYVRVVRHERKQTEKSEQKRKEAIKKLEEKEKQKIVGGRGRGPQLHGFNSEKILESVKDYGERFKVLYSLQYEFIIKDNKGIVIDGPTIQYTNYKKNPEHALIEMDRILSSIASSADVFLLNTEWIYDKYPVGLSYY